MEDVSEGAVVDDFVFVDVEFLKSADIIIEEHALATHVAVDGGRGEELQAVAEDGHDGGGLGNG